MKLKYVKPGDIIWQNRMPGGLCIFLGQNEELDDMGEITYRIYHPIEGYLKGDNTYYYTAFKYRDKIIDCIRLMKGERE